jgi:uncharacterized protein
MSQENVEIARRAYEAFNAGDVSGWLQMHTSDVELHDLANLPDPAVHRGHDEMRKWVDAVMEVTEYLRYEPQRFIDAGEFVLVPARISAKGHQGRVPTEMNIFHVFEFRDGKIRRLRNYLSEDEALEAVGLRE